MRGDWNPTPENQQASTSDIFAKRFDSTGNVIGSEVAVNVPNALEAVSPSIVSLANDGYLVVFADADNTLGKIVLKQQQFDSSGAPVGSAVTLNTLGNAVSSISTGEAIRRDANSYTFVWGGFKAGVGTEIWQQAFLNDGTPVGAETQVNTTTTQTQSQPQITQFDDGTYAIVWTSRLQDGSLNGVYMRRFNAAGVATTAEILVTTSTLNNQQSPTLAKLTDGSLVIAWASNHTDAANYELYAQVFDVAGNKVGTEFLINTFTGGNQGSVHLLAGDDNSFIASYVSYEADLVQRNITRRVFTLDATPVLQSGSAGINVLTGGSGNDDLNGLAGNDTIWGFAGDDYLQGGDNSDKLYGGSGADSLLGQGGRDTLDGGTGNDVMAGGADNDTYYVDSVGDVVTEETVLGVDDGGLDIVYSSVSHRMSNFVERLYLTGSDDSTGTGNSLSNIIYGNSGDNIINGGTGGDSMYGGDGDDIYVVDDSYDRAYEVINSVATTGTDRVESSVTFTLGANIENLLLTGSSNINGTGNADTNMIRGNDGNNILNGAAGADMMYGGAGNDTYYVDDQWDGTFEDAVNAQFGPSDGGGDDGGTDLVYASVSHSLMQFVENLTLTGTTDIDGTGNELNNTILGNTGNNRIDGGTGADTMRGGAGDDTYVVDNVGDLTLENVGGGTDSVESSISLILRNEVENLTLTGVGNINATGNASVNELTGNSGNNALDGRAGADSMWGGAGNDIYIVDNVGDQVSEESTLGVDDGGDDRVTSSVSFTLGDYIERLSLSGSANINAVGNSLNNTINGNSGNNQITGGAGNDNMMGAAGDDTFIFGLGFGRDTVSDSSGTDTIQFAAGITAGMIIFQDVGADRYYAISEVGKTAQQCANRIRVVGGAGGAVIENITYSTDPAPASTVLNQAMINFASSGGSSASLSDTAENRRAPQMGVTTNALNPLF